MPGHAVERGERIQGAVEVVVVPADGGEDWNAHPVHVLPDAQALPEIVVGGVVERLLPCSDRAARGDQVRGAQRDARCNSGEWGRAESGTCEIPGEPQQPMPELHGAAWRIEAGWITVVAGGGPEDGLQTRV